MFLLREVEYGLVVQFTTEAVRSQSGCEIGRVRLFSLRFVAFLDLS
jgi:hypothetical protein